MRKRQSTHTYWVLNPYQQNHHGDFRSTLTGSASLVTYLMLLLCGSSVQSVQSSVLRAQRRPCVSRSNTRSGHTGPRTLFLSPSPSRELVFGRVVVLFCRRRRRVVSLERVYPSYPPSPAPTAAPPPPPLAHYRDRLFLLSLTRTLFVHQSLNTFLNRRGPCLSKLLLLLFLFK